MDCTNPKIGALLHAYELNALADDTLEQFEIHLLECEHCFSEVNSFKSEATMLGRDREIKKVVAELVSDTSQAQSFPSLLWKKLWPKGPFFLKPAFIYMLLLLMAFPVYRTLMITSHPEFPVISQKITLPPPVRGGCADKFFVKDSGKFGNVDFPWEDVRLDKIYELKIIYEDGTVVFSDKQFRNFNEDKVGEQILPVAEMKTGKYRLIISGPNDAKEPISQEYFFRIK